MEAAGTMDKVTQAGEECEAVVERWEGTLPGASASGGAEGIRGRPEVRGARGVEPGRSHSG